MMNQGSLFKKIGLILNELNEQYQFLAQNPEQLSELELELFHANANFLADHVQIIKKIGQTKEQPLALPLAEEKLEESISQQNFATNHTVEINEDIQEEQQIEAVTYADEIKEEPAIELPESKEIEFTPEPKISLIEEEIFKIDNEPSTFEFILNDHAEHETIEGMPQMDYNKSAPDGFITNENNLNTDEKFEFEEKSVDELFNRPLSNEEERIIAEKKKLSLDPLPQPQDLDEDEIGPEPFLVYKQEEQVIQPAVVVEKEPLPIEKEELTFEEAPIPAPIVKSAAPVEDPTYKPTLNDLLASKTISNHINSSKPAIADLKQGINLNDKLLYIKDLFNGYNLAYSEAIDIANKLPNFEAADNFFQKNYAAKNNWADKQGTVDKFYELLNQRFRTPNP